jgi:hypothetical protein
LKEGKKKLGRDKEERPKENKYKEVREDKVKGGRKMGPRSISKSIEGFEKPDPSNLNKEWTWTLYSCRTQHAAPAAEARFHKDETTERQG